MSFAFWKSGDVRLVLDVFVAVVRAVWWLLAFEGRAVELDALAAFPWGPSMGDLLLVPVADERPPVRADDLLPFGAA